MSNCPSDCNQSIVYPGCIANMETALVLEFTGDPQIFTSGTATIITLAPGQVTPVANNGGITFDANGTISVPKDGRYIITIFVSWEGNEMGTRRLSIIKNNDTAFPIAIDSRNATGILAELGVTMTTFAQLSAGDTIQFRALQTSGAVLDLLKTAGSNYIAIARLL